MKKEEVKTGAEKKTAGVQFKKNKELEAFLKTTIDMEEKKYRKIIADSIVDIESEILASLNWNADQRDMIIKMLGKKFKIIDKEIKASAELFKKIMKRQNEIAFFLYTLTLKNEALHGDIIDDKRRRDIAECLSVDPDDIYKVCTPKLQVVK